jgi:hypothetical protein
MKSQKVTSTLPKLPTAWLILVSRIFLFSLLCFNYSAIALVEATILPK